jgi:hypothetical protein
MSSPLGLAALAIALAAGPLADASPAPPPHGFPEIEALHISATDIHPGQTLTGWVETSDNVSYVEARIDYRNTPLQHDGAGHFSLRYTVPWWLPPWLRHAYTLQIVARSVDGVETRKSLQIRVL